MIVSIMQPYLFPWIGYFQLLAQADVFVLYDDASYIKQGHINRNTLLSAGQAQRFTLPVPGASSNKRIGELAFDAQADKLIKTLRQNYQHAPAYQDVMPLIEAVLLHDDRDITACCQRAIEQILGYLGMSRRLVRSSALNYDRTENAENKVIAMCNALGGDIYVNSTGGRHLYSVPAFAAQGIRLRFLQANNVVYDQGTAEFVPNLSIIDVLMHCTPDAVRQALDHYHYAD